MPVFMFRPHAALKVRLPALLNMWAQENKTMMTTDISILRPILYPLLLRFKESAVQTSGRRAEERQETLRRSESAAGEQWRSGHVTREQCTCSRREGGKRARMEWDKVMQKEGCQVFVAAVETTLQETIEYESAR